jgi:hypothetical protein
MKTAEKLIEQFIQDLTEVVRADAIERVEAQLLRKAPSRVKTTKKRRTRSAASLSDDNKKRLRRGVLAVTSSSRGMSMSEIETALRRDLLTDFAFTRNNLRVVVATLKDERCLRIEQKSGPRSARYYRGAV